MQASRRRQLAALLFYYVLLAGAILLLAKRTRCIGRTCDGAVERSFKRCACALVLAARLPEIALERRPAQAAAVLAEWALLEARRLLACAGVSTDTSGHVYLVSLSTCLLVLSAGRRQAPALAAAKLLVVLLFNAHLLKTISLYHTRTECLGGAALSMAACALRVACSRCLVRMRGGALSGSTAQLQRAPIPAAAPKQTRI